MKKILVIIAFFISSISLSAQDLIVTTGNDSINCKVTKVDQDNVYYSKDGIGTTLELIKIKACLYNYYKQKPPVIAATPALMDDVKQQKDIQQEGNSYKRFRFALNGGLSYRTYSIGEGLSTDYENYLKKLRLGYQFEGDASYFFSANRGAGLKLSLYKASNEQDDIWIINNGFINEGNISDDITIIYAGPSFSSRFNNYGSYNSFFFTVSVGYLYYTNDLVNITEANIEGNTIGFNLDFGYDVLIKGGMSLGIQASFMSGSLSEIDYTDPSGTASYYWNESLTRFDIGIGLRF